MTHESTFCKRSSLQRRLEATATVLGVLTLLSGCAEEPPISTPPTLTAETAQEIEEAEAAKEEPNVAAGERQEFDGLEFVVPSSWKKVELSQMQMGIITARFQMPDAGAAVTLTLSRSGGGVEANLDRWKGQFSNKSREDVETISIAGVESTLIDQEGRFAGGFGKPAADGWRMLGAIVPLPDQGYFIKLTGPADEVEAVEDDFRAFIESAARS